MAVFRVCIDCARVVSPADCYRGRCPVNAKSPAWVSKLRQWDVSGAKSPHGHTCTRCGESDPGKLEVHHILPLSEGGTNRIENLTTRCRACHLEAHRGAPP